MLNRSINLRAGEILKIDFSLTCIKLSNDLAFRYTKQHIAVQCYSTL